MRILVVFILLAFGFQQVPNPDNGCGYGNGNNIPTPTSISASEIRFHESQIRKADSLYKNYLPQSNFEEVKAAMEFFDSLNSCQSSAVSRHQSKFSKLHALKPNLIDTLTYRLINFNCAKAHYYHAVGLTEKDDIVGACEHYLIALEIMEDDDIIKSLRDTKTQRRKGKSLCDSATLRLCDSNKEDYEKIRFIALIYNRLGRLFYNENYCDLAILKYKKALKYVDLINDNSYRSNLLKELGNSYQFINNADSALYYYKESLNTSSDQYNKFDVEKCIAQVLYNKGEKDSAYMILKSNLRKININNVKYSYHYTLGNMFYNDKAYDSALYYLKESLDDSIITKKLAFITTLSAIYDSIGNYEKRAYYDNLSSKLFKNNINKEINKSQLQILYNNYNERKFEKTRIEAKSKIRRMSIIVGLTAFIIVSFIMIYIKYKHRKQSNKLRNEINDYVNRIDNYSKDIESKNIIINQKEKQINDYQKTNNQKDKIIDKQKIEIERIKNRLSKKNVNIDAYYASDICKKIMSRKDNDFSCLKEDELALLLKSADEHLGNISERLREKFHSLNKNDIYTICLLILNLEKKLPVLLGRNPKTIWDRLHKLKKLMNVESNKDLYIYIKDNFLN